MNTLIIIPILLLIVIVVVTCLILEKKRRKAKNTYITEHYPYGEANTSNVKQEPLTQEKKEAIRNVVDSLVEDSDKKARKKYIDEQLQKKENETEEDFWVRVDKLLSTMTQEELANVEIRFFNK